MMNAWNDNLHVCMFNPEKKWYRWIYLQSRNTDTYIESGYVDLVGGKLGQIGRLGLT